MLRAEWQVAKEHHALACQWRCGWRPWRLAVAQRQRTQAAAAMMRCSTCTSAPHSARVTHSVQQHACRTARVRRRSLALPWGESCTRSGGVEESRVTCSVGLCGCRRGAAGGVCNCGR